MDNIEAPMDRKKRLYHLVKLTHRLEVRMTKLENRSLVMSNYRLIVFAAGCLLGIGAYYWIPPGLAILIIATAVFAFATTVYRHRQIEKSLNQHRLWHTIKSTHIARMNLAWDRLPKPQAGPVNDPAHPFESDLDITGDKSLLHLLDTSVSPEGSQRLRDWLLTTIPDYEAILNRQALVRELTPQVNFRDRIRLKLSETAAAEFSGEKLLTWLHSPSQLQQIKTSLLILGVLAIVNIGLLIGYFFGLNPMVPLSSFVLYVVIFLYRSSSQTKTLKEAIDLEFQLTKLHTAAEYLENFNYQQTPNLAGLCALFLDPKQRPSRILQCQRRILSAIALRINPLIFALINATFPWDFLFVKQFEESKAALKTLLPQWLEVLCELEALSSLANLAWLNPHYTMPEIRPESDPLTFQAEYIGHPLIHHDQQVCNDFTIAQIGDISLITGSNMAGKSTFLRTIGINLCLAYAGGPINADRLVVSQFQVYTCIKINDSVTGGFSYFYAEVKRLKALLDALSEASVRPVLFLIDEIFKGTNNRERNIGSRAYIEALAGKFGLGLVTTHDLDLVKLAETIPRLANFHFREDVVEGKMQFDYKLRRGPCPTTNALKIMALEGLPVTP